MRRNQRKKMKKTISKKAIIIISSSFTILVLACLVIIGITQNNTNVKPNNQEIVANEEKDIKYELEYSKTNGGKFVKVGNTLAYLDSMEEKMLSIVNLETGNIKKVITPVDLEKIYFDGEKIYGMPNHYSGRGIYQIDLEGKVDRIYEGECVQIWLEDDKIYFVKQSGFDDINQTPQGNLCVMDKNGENITKLIDDVKNYFKIQGDNIYYTDGTTRALCEATEQGEIKNVLAQGRTYIISVTEKYLVYLDYSEGETYHVFYFEDNTNHKVGRFGSCYINEEEGYIYTRKLIGDNNEIENDFSLFKIDSNKKEEQIIWQKGDMQTLNYVYNNYIYFTNQGIHMASLENPYTIPEKLDMGQTYFLDGSAYELRRENNEIKKILITKLRNNEKKEIELKFEDNNKEENNQVQMNTNNNSNANSDIIQNQTKTKEEIYGWKNGSVEGKEIITENQAKHIWKINIGNFGKNNKIIDYDNYVHLLSISAIHTKPNSLFQQKDNAQVVYADFTRKAWKLETSDTEAGLQRLEIYIDYYTGDIIGGKILGD